MGMLMTEAQLVEYNRRFSLGGNNLRLVIPIVQATGKSHEWALKDKEARRDSRWWCER